MGIIGVVAAITIPQLVRNYQKSQTVVKLKKNYSILSQMFVRSVTDNGDVSTWDFTSNTVETTKNFFDTYIGPYIRYDKICKTHTDCGYVTNSFRELNNNGHNIVSPESRTTVILADSTVIQFSRGTIIVDINGSKAPNKNCTDVFWFTFRPKGIQPIKGTTVNDGGRGCAAKIINDNWQIKDDYPW